MKVKVISFYDEVKFKPNRKSFDIVDIFETIENEKGQFVYKKTKSVNRQAIMDSQAKNTDIMCLYKRLIKGDSSILNAREGVYLNMVNAPKDIYEMSNYSKYVEKIFNENELLKKVYKNNFNDYFKDYQKGVDTIKEKLDYYTLGVINSMKIKNAAKQNEKQKVEVKENETK